MLDNNLLKSMMEHIDGCPLNWRGDKIVIHKSKDNNDVAAWLQKLFTINISLKKDVTLETLCKSTN